MDARAGSSETSDLVKGSTNEKEYTTIDMSFMHESIRHIMASDSVYETLKVRQDATNGTGLSKKKIKDNFIKMARAIHPDKCLHPDAHAAFSKLRAAYEEINNDLNNPKPISESLPKMELKQRRQVAAVTSRLLRGAATDESMVGEGGSDLSCLRRFCDQGKAVSFGVTEDDREARKTKCSSAASSESITFSSATTPVDLFASISPKATKVHSPLSETSGDYISSREASPIVHGMKKCRLTPSGGDERTSTMQILPHDLAL